MKPQTPVHSELLSLCNKLDKLDSTINKIVKWLNCKKHLGHSLMLAGDSFDGSTFHEIVLWNEMLPLPVAELKTFLESYAGRLAAEKLVIERRIAEIDKPILDSVNAIINNSQNTQL